MLSDEIIQKIKARRSGLKLPKTITISQKGLDLAEVCMKKISLNGGFTKKGFEVKISFFIDFLIDLFYESNKNTFFNMKGERE